ncbi:hypothetical protein [Candidatus Pelagadaptatus aseana]|uniref:hypothetical protein n=1 Tax=Candidatus Pelagadaptatus aseana TaxID=3120508 RepID=UPI003C6F7FD7
MRKELSSSSLAILASPLYPAVSYLALYLFITEVGYSSHIVDRTVMNIFVFAVSAIACTVFGFLIVKQKLKLWGLACSFSSIFYWYVVRPEVHDIKNILSDASAWFTMIYSTALPLILALVVSSHLTRRSSKDAVNGAA